ncbi:MAG: RNA polymerase sigma factor [Planctomycetota bacterium]
MVTHEADFHLAQRCLAGDSHARETLGARMACVPRIVAARNRRLPAPMPESALPDVASEVVLQAWNRLADYNGFAAFESWLYRFCEFTLLNAARQRVRNRTSLLDEAAAAAAEDAPGSWVDAERIQRALERLPEDELIVVRAKHFDDLTFEAIAERIAIPLTTAKGRYYRAMDRLRQWLRSRELEARG